MTIWKVSEFIKASSLPVLNIALKVTWFDETSKLITNNFVEFCIKNLSQRAKQIHWRDHYWLLNCMATEIFHIRLGVVLAVTFLSWTQITLANGKYISFIYSLHWAEKEGFQGVSVRLENLKKYCIYGMLKTFFVCRSMWLLCLWFKL